MAGLAKPKKYRPTVSGLIPTPSQFAAATIAAGQAANRCVQDHFEDIRNAIVNRFLPVPRSCFLFLNVAGFCLSP